MELELPVEITGHYSSASQKIRVMSERWVTDWVFCPNCGSNLTNYENNKPVADFYCKECREEFELKSQNGVIKGKIVDGAYSTMIKRLADTHNPNFFLMTYEKPGYIVSNFVVIPKYFFTPGMIEKRKPLSNTARRAGWVGCNILLNKVPQSGKIYYIQNKMVVNSDEVQARWQKTSFVKDTRDIDAKGWLMDVLLCLEKIQTSTFTLEEVYQFEHELKIQHPSNNNIRAKIRQQLQLLRDRGLLRFLGSGKYKKL